ncbi:MAG: tRNA (N(6)-L-threonylcarbamoyladenosine(37)-C(2))-methylthiotransferase MtaB [Chloroflexi bacterium]|nr:tRNA (N(6)-L-threonylcarbamoyladenosine(37)-C(2))-methylthiotransferase MtaB [Chloroflexota bacterium]
MSNVYLTTLGCRLNEAEVAGWARRFQAQGHRVVHSPQEAQVMLLNSCAVTTEAARKSRQFIKRLHRQNPEARLVITGCYAQLEPERVAALTGVDLVIGNDEKERLVELVSTRLDLHAMPAMAAEPESAHMYPGSRTRAFVKVQDGCRNRCTFCIVTIARGPERSRPIDAVIDEINALHRGGYQEVVLTGVHLGGYGRDLGTDLYALVDAILHHTDIPRLRLSSLEPWDLPPHFWNLWQNPRLMPHLHLPLQSGCDSTLRRMARRCDTATYARLVEDARAAIPDLTLTTDLIVGFPGETEAEWAATVDFVQRIGFAHMHIFTFSPREGTAAARMKDQVPAEIKRTRSRQMHAMAAAMKAEYLARYVGATRAVLWEGPGKSTNHGHTRWLGYTDHYLRVETTVSAHLHLENRITPAQLHRLNADKTGLLARIAANEFAGYA